MCLEILTLYGLTVPEIILNTAVFLLNMLGAIMRYFALFGESFVQNSERVVRQAFYAACMCAPEHFM